MNPITPLFVAALILVSVAKAQEFHPGNPLYKSETDVVILNYVPGSKSAKLFFTGSKIADFDLKKDAKIVSVVMMNNQKKETLKLNQAGNFYEVESTTTFPKNYQIIVNTELRGKPKEMKLNINPNSP